MKGCFVRYTDTFILSPMTPWVHLPTDGRPWYLSRSFEPPLPKPVPGKGYPRYYVELDGFTWVFASFAEINECIGVLSQKNLPSIQAGNRHWLSRLPGWVKPWRYREKAVRYLQKAREEFAMGSAREV